MDGLTASVAFPFVFARVIFRPTDTPLFASDLQIFTPPVGVSTTVSSYELGTCTQDVSQILSELILNSSFDGASAETSDFARIRMIFESRAWT